MFDVQKIKREWKKVDDFTRPFSGSRYTTWESPDGLFAAIHEADQELVSVIDKDGKIIYMHPRTVEGLRKIFGGGDFDFGI